MMIIMVVLIVAILIMTMKIMIGMIDCDHGCVFFIPDHSSLVELVSSVGRQRVMIAAV